MRDCYVAAWRVAAIRCAKELATKERYAIVYGEKYPYDDEDEEPSPPIGTPQEGGNAQ